MSDEFPQFDKAEYAPTSVVATERPTVQDATPSIDPQGDAFLPLAIAYGLVAAAVGAFLYAGFIRITHIEIGYLAVGIAYLIAKAMTVGTKGRGGQAYQITAVVLTLLSVVAANSLLLYWQLKADGTSVPLSAHNLVALAKYGFASPYYEFQDSPGSALIGLFILFIGLRAAWRMTSGVPGAVRHPFAR